MASALQLVLLARLDAELTVDLQYTYTRHRADRDVFGTREESLWRRPPRPMGKGGMGEVYREECIKGSRIGRLRAVKAIEKPSLPEAAKIDYTRELEAIARFSAKEYEHWFVKSLGWYEDTHFVFITMEFVELGDLYQHIAHGPLEESETQLIISQVLKGVSFMHQKGYVHRDLKPQNLLVVNSGPRWHVKIADFGLSKKIVASSSFRSRGAGTLAFLPPEFWGFGSDNDSSSDDDDPQTLVQTAIDIWAVGVISFLLLTGELPFLSPQEDTKALRRYAQRKTAFPIRALNARRTSANGQACIKLFLAPNARDRPAAELGLQHSWLKVPQKDPRLSKPATLPNDQASATWDTDDIAADLPIPLSKAEYPVLTNQKQGEVTSEEVSPSKWTTHSPSAPQLSNRHPKSEQQMYPKISRNETDHEITSSFSGLFSASAAQQMVKGLWNKLGTGSHRSALETTPTWEQATQPPREDVSNREFVSSPLRSRRLNNTSTQHLSLHSRNLPESSQPTVKKIELLDRISRIWNLALSPDGRFAVLIGFFEAQSIHPTGLFDIKLVVWNIQTNCMEHEVTLFPSLFPDKRGIFHGSCEMAVSANYRVVVSFEVLEDMKTGASPYKTTVVWDLSTGRMCKWRKHLYTISSLALSPGGEYVLLRVAPSAAHNCSCVLCDTETGHELHRLNFRAPQAYEHFAISPGGQSVAAADEDELVKRWSITGRPYPRLEGFQEWAMVARDRKAVLVIALSPSDNLLAVVFSINDTGDPLLGYRIQVWDAVTGRMVICLPGDLDNVHLHQNGVPYKLAFSHDGAILAIGFHSELKEPLLSTTVRYWNVQTGKERAQTSEANDIDPLGLVEAMAFSPDGTLVRLGRPRANVAQDHSDLLVWEQRIMRN